MIDTLVQEEIRTDEGTTGACMEYALKNNIIDSLVQLSEADVPPGIRGETIRAVSNMINLLDDKFLIHHAVHAPTLKLLHSCMSERTQYELYSEEIVELMRNLCYKIHGYPELLHIFFHDKEWLKTPQKTTPTSQKTTNKLYSLSKIEHRPDSPSKLSEPKAEYEFVLFSYLLMFIHKEGKTGDYTRHSVLYIIELATGALRDFILKNSDFCTIVAAGLGAFYSQLPRKLRVTSTIDGKPRDNGLGQNGVAAVEEDLEDAEPTSSPEFKFQLELFLKYLNFTQEILDRCPSSGICNTLLSNVKTLFLENILYPSLLECSDTDGSAVAVITYIDVLIRSITQQDLNNMIVTYLMNTGTNEPEEEKAEKLEKPNKLPPQIPSLTAVKESDAESLHSSVGSVDVSVGFESSSILPYNMKDLIFTNCKSNSQHVVTASLKLLHTMLNHHCRQSLDLLEVQVDEEMVGSSDEQLSVGHPHQRFSSIDTHLHILDLYLSLLSVIDVDHDQMAMAKGYDNYLLDVELTIEEHERLHRNLVAKKGIGRKYRKHPNLSNVKYLNNQEEPHDTTMTSALSEENAKKDEKATVCKHSLKPTDALIQILLNLLSRFFAHSCDLNLALTGVISALASCPCRSLEGWLTLPEMTEIRPQAPVAEDFLGDTSFQDQENMEDDRSEDGCEPDSRSIKSYSNASVTTAATSYSSIPAKNPTIFLMLRILTQHVLYYRSKVPNFDQLLSERRASLFESRNTGETFSAKIKSAMVKINEDSDEDDDLFAPSSADAVPINGSFLQNMNSFDGQDSDGGPDFAGIPPPPVKVEEICILVDNVIILEEAIKEIVSIIQVRRSMGVDEVRFL
ncbi:hypothetical protein K493DRAFT_409768 [Basidiobolus meristosporus CBS 931.73]|uniref:FHF complex subunit HOOK-interacting protein C-terminal domain-containing protein n=1 Tax=Basidiobolus meristosporus CBS 931.73 TaxID=1314790 RepID=A0A1Y1XY39_9FUNG|nr:hypothetical protein K493DRAFT_409768 [Basidiobolus meristosporus CBS 931.73]|eukprot:ORX90651.1 hypothetical protein K493DRAFT_409768 [Basidiobolus meristosporus CBS 931.73]